MIARLLPTLFCAVPALFCALAVAPAGQAAEPALLVCLGSTPRFALTVKRDVVTFDYLGDGTFRLDPPLTSPDVVYQRHSLITRRQIWPVVLEERACGIQSLSFPMRIELRAPVNGGTQSFFGCCLWADGEG